MATYRYRAKSADGTEMKGVISAADQVAAAVLVKESYPIILSLQEVKEKKNTLLNKEIGGPGKLNIRNLSVMCSQLAISLKAGIPLARCLEMIGRQTEDKLLKNMLLASAEGVAGGSRVSDTMEKNCPKLPATFLETVRAGEESGNIELSFQEMAKYYENQYKVRNKVKSVLSYPIFVLAVAVVVIMVVMIYVIPTLAQTFQDLNGQLPLITVILIRISNFFRNWWYVILILMAAVWLLLKALHSTPDGKLKHARRQLKAPVLGKIRLLSGCAQMSGTMAMLLKAGLTVDRAIAITARTLDNFAQETEIEAIAPKIEEGQSFGECMRDCSTFPATLKEMCVIGEETGELDTTLEIISQFYSNEAQEATGRALARLEPAMLIALAFFTGFIVISIYMPMFTMYNYM